ncbi:MAG: hypothetical protein V1820_05190 [archaeon]
MEKTLERIVKKAKETLDRKLSAADSISPIAREAKIASDRAIALLHSGKESEALALLRKAQGGIAALTSALSRDPSLKSTNFQISLAFQEYAEAIILLHILKGRDIPNVAAPPEEYLLGLADAAGELNRAYLEARIRRDFKSSARYSEKVREIEAAFSELDYPDFIVPSFRQKKDLVRRIYESILSTESKDVSRKNR